MRACSSSRASCHPLMVTDPTLSVVFLATIFLLPSSLYRKGTAQINLSDAVENVFDTPEALAPIGDRLPLLRTSTKLLRRRQAACDNLRRGVRIHTGDPIWLTAACFVFQRRW